MATYVLVPGAWLGAWAWRDVTEDLRTRGHDVYALSLTGLGERAHLAGAEVGLETHVRDIIGLIEAEDLHDVVLVGHSYAGASPVPMAAHRIGDRLSHVVYVDCAPIDHGWGMIDEFAPATAERMRAEVAADGDGWRLAFPSVADLGSEALREGLGAETLERMRRKATPHPFASFTDKVDRPGEAVGDPIPVSIVCADILAMIESQNSWMLGLLARPEWQRYDIATGHWPMLSAPKELADALDGLTR
ncbi:esterase [Actinorhabdospora filicis]|uniref:Esterase n=1 Tax=Actinorhabdospora filicis TaxID=1785913 RepID=A0A9W6SP05_9ACTN|nr:alpha/beta hydrolase [Actinorhabdospora filicis]GLZ78101.1 esterase [Actinorhabdospora filicis]